jgi:hypothetical protein
MAAMLKRLPGGDVPLQVLFNWLGARPISRRGSGLLNDCGHGFGCET